MSSGKEAEPGEGPGRVSRRSVAGLALGGAVSAAAISAGSRAQSTTASGGAAIGNRPEGQYIPLLDFDVDPSGRNDSSEGFRRALAEAQGKRLFVPTGTFLVAGLGGLAAAGSQIVGASRWKTILRTENGAGPIFANGSAMRGTSAFTLVRDLQLDLNGTDGVAIDLASVNASTIQRVHVRGGFGAGEMRGTGVRFAAPLRKGAYDNALYDCSFEYLDRAVAWEVGANSNSVFNCRLSNCRIGYDTAPGGSLDTPKVFGGRVERCHVGLREGASQGAYFAVRFEDNREADVEFTAASVNAAIFGGHTASSDVVLKNIELASSPSVESSDLGFRAIEESPSRPKVSTGRHVFGKAGKAPDVVPGVDYAAYFADPVVLGSHLRPADGVSPALGTERAPFSHVSLRKGVLIDGSQVVGPRRPAIEPDETGSANSRTVNQILDVLRSHGLIED